MQSPLAHAGLEGLRSGAPQARITDHADPTRAGVNHTEAAGTPIKLILETADDTDDHRTG
jgi:hypothetical protein